MNFKIGVFFSVLFGFTLAFEAAAMERGFVEDPNTKNLALLVGVSHGLPGIDLDLKYVDRMATHDANRFQVKQIFDEEGTVANTTLALSDLSNQIKGWGTMLFYFSGHGSPGSIYLQDRSMKVQEIREAIEKARVGLGPIERLVLMFDSCYSGSLLDPIRRSLPLSRLNALQSIEFVNAVVNEMMPTSRDPYWDKLFVFASSRADETSLASQEGSIFTLALAKAFQEAVAQNNTIGEFVKKTQAYTEGHHPVARLVPASLENEKMVP